MKNLILSIRNLFKPKVRWDFSRMLSWDGKRVYTVRDAKGHEREMIHNGRWVPISKRPLTTQQYE